MPLNQLVYQPGTSGTRYLACFFFVCLGRLESGLDLVPIYIRTVSHVLISKDHILACSPVCAPNELSEYTTHLEWW